MPAEPLKQPSIELELSVEVWVVCVVVVWVVVSGVAGCWLGEVDDGDVDDGDVDCGEPGEVCATAQTADNNRIAVIKYVFLIYVLLEFLGLLDSGPECEMEAALKT
ncbi:MAG TPA: hypothetical protein VGK24_20835 [Candidatus Angelobacter sp.]